MNDRIDALYASITKDDAAAVRATLAEAPALVREHHAGSTPLHLAAFRGLERMVGTLLELGADARAVDADSGSTPLHWAAEGGHTEVVRLLLAHGAGLEVRDAWYGLTPLGWATSVFWTPIRKRKDRSPSAALLRASGALPDAFTELGADDVAGLRRVLTAAPAELARRLGFAGFEMTPLHWAGAYGREDAIRLLLELGADVTARTSLGLTPLGATLERAQNAAAAVFVETGHFGDESTAVVGGFADALQGTDPKVLTPGLASRLLFVAAGEGHAKVVPVLRGFGADPATRVRVLVGQHPLLATPLHLAASRGHEATARALLEAGAPPSAGAQDGEPTPLHLAASEGHEGTTWLLLQHGADRSARETRFYDATPADWADAAGLRELAAALRRGA